MPPEKESKTEAEEVPKEEATTKVETKDDVSTKNDDMKKQKAKNEDKMEETDSNKDEEGTKKVDTKKDDKKNQEANDEDKMEIEETDSKKKQVGAKKVGTKKEEGTKKDDAKKQETNTENEEEGTDSDDEGSEEETNDGGRELGKRKRKSSVENAFEPLDFTMQGAKQVKIIKGRGKKLKGMPSVVASIESHSLEDVLFAHKFLFGNRGSTLKKKELTANLLEFSGYLKDAPKGYDKDKLEAEDELEETKYSKKAFKMVLAQVKMLCDFFDVLKVSEEGKPLNKDDMIENLLDFLSQPHPDFLNAENPNLSKKKATPKKKTTATTTTPAMTMKDPFDLVRKHKRGKMPSDEAMRQWVKAYIVSFDMDSATTKHAIRTASDKFGVDMVQKKDTIKMMLAEEM